MAQLDCDDKKIESLLAKLCALLEENGAYFHDDIAVVCKEGEFSVKAAQSIDPDQEIVVIPESCFIPMDFFDLSFASNAISISSYNQKIQPQWVEILELVFEIYSYTGKLSNHRKNSFLSLYYKDPDIFNRLVSCYDFDVFEILGIEDKSDEITALGQSFLALRMFTPDLDTHWKHMQDVDVRSAEKVFLPFVEYFDHHLDAFRVELFLDEEMMQASKKIKPFSTASADNLFIRYGVFDAHELFILHSYVEENNIFARSVSLAIDLPEVGVLEIDRMCYQQNIENLPDEVKDMGFYFPPVDMILGEGRAWLGYLLIPPPDKHYAMRQVLKIVIGGMTDNSNLVWPAVLLAEKKIIGENIKYYNSLLDDLNNYSASDEVEHIVEGAKKMAATQLQRIKSYRPFEEAMTG